MDANKIVKTCRHNGMGLCGKYFFQESKVIPNNAEPKTMGMLYCRIDYVRQSTRRVDTLKLHQ
jgi:hypothetical protein